MKKRRYLHKSQTRRFYMNKGNFIPTNVHSKVSSVTKGKVSLEVQTIIQVRRYNLKQIF